MIQTIEEVTAIVGITVMFLYTMYKLVEFYNPYTEEIIESGSSGPSDEPVITHKWARIKRTYKNGTIKYTQKTWKI